MTAAIVLLRRVWWLIPIAALAAGWWWTDHALADAKLTIANERQVLTQERAEADRVRAASEIANANRLIAAGDAYAARLAAREPIILESTNTLREYAQTDAGRVRCLGADRVRGLDGLATDLADAARSTAGGAGTVPDADPAPAGGR